MMRAVAGTVLNQDSDNPMSGEIVGWDKGRLRIHWASGLECNECPIDVILTGDVQFGEASELGDLYHE